MSQKLKYTVEQKAKACAEYLSGKKSALQLKRELNMGKNGTWTIRKWARLYKAHGEKIFDNTHGNHSYSKELKEKAVREYYKL